MASSELAPFAKTGGLADVTAALAAFLQRAGHDVRLFLPLYRRVAEQGLELRPIPGLQDISLELGGRRLWFSLSRTPLPGADLDVYLIRCPELFDRPGLYDSEGDEHLRFAFFSRAVLEGCQHLGFAPDIVHCNDWHTALIPFLVRTMYGWDQMLSRTRTLLTIHNLAYQGIFPAAAVEELGLAPWGERVHQEDLAAGVFSFLKTGILYADALTTVSETYAKEIQTEEYGMGLHHTLRAREDHLFGIVNGVDYRDWDPATDSLIPVNYSAEDLTGKWENQRRLLQELKLQPAGEQVAVVGLVARLTAQKGINLLFEPLPQFLSNRDLRFVVLGSGDPGYEKDFEELQRMYPGKVCYYRGYSNKLAHWIEAASDVFLMPSRFEPCGLNQMYSLRYGTPPVVRRTGGLADTVKPFDPATGSGTGFVFDHYSSDGLRWALGRALDCFAEPRSWRQLMQNGMAEDFSWDRQGPHYVRLFRQLTS
jgi:starch synthase